MIEYIPWANKFRISIGGMNKDFDPEQIDEARMVLWNHFMESPQHNMTYGDAETAAANAAESAYSDYEEYGR